MFFRKLKVQLISIMLYFGKRRLAKKDRGFRSLMESIRERKKIPKKERIRRIQEADKIARLDKERSREDRGITGMV